MSFYIKQLKSKSHCYDDSETKLDFFVYLIRHLFFSFTFLLNAFTCNKTSDGPSLRHTQTHDKDHLQLDRQIFDC